MKKELKVGDIMADSLGWMRIITAMNERGCYYIDYRFGHEGWFYNPCRAYVSMNAMEKRHKVGEIPEEVMRQLQENLSVVIKEHNKAFALCDEIIGHNPMFSMDKFLKQ